MSAIKDRNSMDLKEAEDIKKRWKEYTEELWKKDHNDPDNHDGVITHLEQDILECEVKWALGNITMNKASGADEIPAEWVSEWVKSLSHVFATPWTVAHQAPPIHGTFQARILMWVPIYFSRRSSWPRDWTQVSRIVGRHFTVWATREIPPLITSS